MCGLIGSYSLSSNFSWAKSGIDKLRYRGPDSQATKLINNFLIFGSTRLAMTDPLPRSNQPMENLDNGDVISFNGEIYNYKELRNQLIKLGIKFETSSDTEVLLKLLGTYGIDILPKLNGMFAFVFYSKKFEEIYFVRDYLGKKPLYYEKTEDGLKWSSSLSSFENLTKKHLNDLALHQYLSLGYLLDPITAMENITSVMPGEVLTFSLRNRQLRSSSFKRDEPKREDLAIETIRESLTQSIQDRIEGHSSVALSLSGGVDSSIIALELANLETHVTTFSAIWPDSDKSRYNIDGRLAQNISKKLGLNHVPVEMISTYEIEQSLKEFLIAMQEPNNNPSGVSMMKLYESMSSVGNRLILTGDGSDEIFCGYERYRAVSRLPNLLYVSPGIFGSRLHLDSSRKQHKIQKLARAQLSPKHPESWLGWHNIFTPPEVDRLIDKSNFQTNNTPLLRNALTNLVTLPPRTDKLKALMLRDHQIWLAMESNRKLDRVSMNYSTEARSPFQDDRVINAAKFALEATANKPFGKKALWEAYPELNALGVRQDKAGFTSPVGHWLRCNPNLIKSSLSALKNDVRFNKLELNRLASAPHRGIYRELSQLWTLVVLGTWLEL